MVGEACLPSNAYYPRTPDYTLYSGVHVCWSEHSDSSFVYEFGLRLRCHDHNYFSVYPYVGSVRYFSCTLCVVVMLLPLFIPHRISGPEVIKL